MESMEQESLTRSRRKYDNINVTELALRKLVALPDNARFDETKYSMMLDIVKEYRKQGLMVDAGYLVCFLIFSFSRLFLVFYYFILFIYLLIFF
jgi:hypothetical protein